MKQFRNRKRNYSPGSLCPGNSGIIGNSIRQKKNPREAKKLRGRTIDTQGETRAKRHSLSVKIFIQI